MDVSDGDVAHPTCTVRDLYFMVVYITVALWILNEKPSFMCSLSPVTEAEQGGAELTVYM